MEIRQLTEKDREGFAKLGRYAFDSARNTYEDCVPENIEKDAPWLKDMSQVWGVFDQKDGLVSASAYFKSIIVIRKKEFNFGGVWGVATAPHWRNRGLVRKTFKRMLQEMQKEVEFSILYPFKYEFYEQFGYKMSDVHHVYQLEVRDIISRPVKNRTVREVLDIDDMKEIYTRIVESNKYNYIVKRNEADWRRKIDRKKPGYFFVCYDEKDKPYGYLIVRFGEKDSLGVEESEKTIYLQEAFWFDRETKQALFNFLKAHMDHRQYVLFGHADPNILSYVSNNYVKSYKINSSSMARIIDVKAVLESLNYPIDSAHNFTVQIEDEMCEWNNKTFQVTVDRGNCKVVETATESPNVVLDIGSMTQMVIGYQTPSDLYDSWDIEASDEMLQTLDRLFPRQNTFLRDFF